MTTDKLGLVMSVKLPQLKITAWDIPIMTSFKNI